MNELGEAGRNVTAVDKTRPPKQIERDPAAPGQVWGAEVCAKPTLVSDAIAVRKFPPTNHHVLTQKLLHGKAIHSPNRSEPMLQGAGVTSL